jgi:uncharacterized protein YqgC (DUF456 family)
MDIALIIIALVLSVIGLLGVVIPVLPGTIFSYVGLLCAFFVTGSVITISQLIVLGVISVAAILLDYLLPGYFSKLFGGTKAGIMGATIGTFVGIFFGVVGIIFAPFIGAVVGEILGSKIPLEQAVKVGFGSLLSFFVGTGIKLLAALYMLYYTVKVFVFVVI